MSATTARIHAKAARDPMLSFTSVRSSGLLQRKCACGGTPGPTGECEECRKKRLQRKVTQPSTFNHQHSEIPPIVHDVLRSPGQPLDAETRGFMEPRFGHDFSRVRVHTDELAAESAQAVNALAYTVGRDVVFGAGRFAPNTMPGRQLLAHELTHTIQQSQGPSASALMSSSLPVSSPSDSYELEAEAQAARVVEGQTKGPTLVQERTGIASLQRRADINEAPSGLPCILTTGASHPSGTDVLFDISSSDLKASGRADVAAFARAWVADGSTPQVFVDGWASEDGPQPLNWRLSCERAEAVKAALVARGVPAGKITTLAHGESTQFSTSDLTKNRRAIITQQPAIKPPTPPIPEPTPPTPPAPTITSETVATSPGARTRTTIGVGEEVNLTYSAGTTRWTTSGSGGRIRGLLSSDTGDTVTLTAPDTAQRITVTAGTATLAFDVIAPTGVHMDRFPGTGIKHKVNRPDVGIGTLPFLLPDTVNFLHVVYRELDATGVPTDPGVYSCNTFKNGHCNLGGAGASCGDLLLTSTVVAGKGTQAIVGDCVYSGRCPGTRTPPFAPGSITVRVPYEYKVGAGAFHWFAPVPQVFTLAADASTLTAEKAGANGATIVAAATSTIPRCP